jgi:hypothetical protein
VVLRSTIRIRYKTSDPVELHDIPVPTGGPGGVGFFDVTITDKNPEYHYYNGISGTVYDLLNKKRVYAFLENDESQDDSSNCSKCIRENIDNIFNDVQNDIKDMRAWRKYQRLNHLNLKCF